MLLVERGNANARGNAMLREARPIREKWGTDTTRTGSVYQDMSPENKDNHQGVDIVFIFKFSELAMIENKDNL